MSESEVALISIAVADVAGQSTGGSVGDWELVVADMSESEDSLEKSGIRRPLSS